MEKTAPVPPFTIQLPFVKRFRSIMDGMRMNIGELGGSYNSQG
jgi:hypothetical protein